MTSLALIAWGLDVLIRKVYIPPYDYRDDDGSGGSPYSRFIYILTIMVWFVLVLVAARLLIDD